MEIDTLIFSGASSKAIIFLGFLNYLIEERIIDKELNNIKKIYCVSSSYLFMVTVILLKYDYEYIKDEIFNFDFNEMLNINDLSLKSLIDNYGFINYNKNHIYVKKILKEKYNIDKMSLLKLYKISGIHIVVKAINVSKQKVEYIDHINNPKMNILKLIQMTTCIPLLFKPTKYKGYLYLDGGLCGNCPIEENESDKYLCINLLKTEDNYEINNVFDFIIKGWEMYDPNILLKYDNNRTILINVGKLGIGVTNFNISKEQKKIMLDLGYNITKEHFTNLQYS